MGHLNLVVHWLAQARGRSVLTMLSVTAAFVLFGLLQGLNQGIDAYIGSIAAGRLIVTSRGGLVGFLPQSYGRRIRSVRGVGAVADLGFFGGYFRESRNSLPLYATSANDFFEVYPELSIPRRDIRAMDDLRTGAIVSRPLSAQFGWKIGDTVPIGSSIFPNRDATSSWPITITGIYDLAPQSNLPNMLLINYTYLDGGRTRLNGRTNVFIVRLDGTRAPQEVGVAIDALFANSDAETHTGSEQNLAQARIEHAADIKVVADVTAGAVMFMLLFVTGNTMMQSFRQRTNQLAVLRTIGFSPARIVALVLGESVLLCVVAAGMGLAIARLLFPVGRAAAFDPSSQLAQINMPPITIVLGLAIATLLALASALPAAWRAGRLNVIDALAER